MKPDEKNAKSGAGKVAVVNTSVSLCYNYSN